MKAAADMRIQHVAGAQVNGGDENENEDAGGRHDCGRFGRASSRKPDLLDKQVWQNHVCRRRRRNTRLS